jgi:hypothetical protein
LETMLLTSRPDPTPADEIAMMIHSFSTEIPQA